MKDIVKYYVIKSSDIDILIYYVNDYISKGWEPVGGVNTIPGPQGNACVVYYLQAMVLKHSNMGLADSIAYQNELENK